MGFNSNTISHPKMETMTNLRMNSTFWLTDKVHSMAPSMNTLLAWSHLQFGLLRTTAYRSRTLGIRRQQPRTVASIKTILVKIMVSIWMTVQLHLGFLDGASHPMSEVIRVLQRHGDKDKPLGLPV